MLLRLHCSVEKFQGDPDDSSADVDSAERAYSLIRHREMQLNQQHHEEKEEVGL